jgi:hypothetical protein
MTSHASEAPPGFAAVISRSWRILQAHPGPLLLAAVPTVLALLSLSVAFAPPGFLFFFLIVAFPNADVIRVIFIALFVERPLVRMTMAAVAGVVWAICADASAHKVVAYFCAKRQEARELAPTMGRGFLLVKSLKLLATAAVCLSVCGGLAYGCRRLLWGFVFPVVEEGG